MELAPGTIVGPFVVEEVLGEGGMAVVYRVRHGLEGTRHALKVLNRFSKEIQLRLLDEGRHQASLGSAAIQPWEAAALPASRKGVFSCG